MLEATTNVDLTIQSPQWRSCAVAEVRIAGTRLGSRFQNESILKLRVLRTIEVSLVEPCLTIIVGTGDSWSEGVQMVGNAASRTTYESSVEGEGDFMVELEGKKARSLSAAAKMKSWCQTPPRNEPPP